MDDHLGWNRKIANSLFDVLLVDENEGMDAVILLFRKARRRLQRNSHKGMRGDEFF
jgi:hypothetical protein